MNETRFIVDLFEDRLSATFAPETAQVYSYRRPKGLLLGHGEIIDLQRRKVNPFGAAAFERAAAQVCVSARSAMQLIRRHFDLRGCELQGPFPLIFRKCSARNIWPDGCGDSQSAWVDLID